MVYVEDKKKENNVKTNTTYVVERARESERGGKKDKEKNYQKQNRKKTCETASRNSVYDMQRPTLDKRDLQEPKETYKRDLQEPKETYKRDLQEPKETYKRDLRDGIEELGVCHV